MGMTIDDDLKKECQYCYREIDNSGLEGFRCTNRTAIRARDSSWCYPKNANESCSICEYCEPKQNMGMTIDGAIGIITAKGNYSYTVIENEAKDVLVDIARKYQMVRVDYENRLKADMVAMLTEIQLEIDELRAKKHFQYKHGQEHGLNDALELIQQKIDKLKEQTDGTNNRT